MVSDVTLTVYLGDCTDEESEALAEAIMDLAPTLAKCIGLHGGTVTEGDAGAALLADSPSETFKGRGSSLTETSPATSHVQEGKRMTDLATFEDKFGDERVIHKTRHGLRVKRTHKTPILAMNPVVGVMVGERVRQLRQERGYTLKELAELCGMTAGWPKNRMWEIEKGTRQEGLRFGTLYALAMALGVEVAELLPSVEEVSEAAQVRQVVTRQVNLA